MLRRTAKPSPASTPTQSMNAASLMHEPKSVADVAFPPQLPFRVHPRKWSTGISRHRLGRVGRRPSSHPGSWGRPTGWSRCPTAASRPTRCRYHKLSARCGGAGQGAEALQLGRAGRRTKTIRAPNATGETRGVARPHMRFGTPFGRALSKPALDPVLPPWPVVC